MGFARFLADRGRSTQLVHADDFTSPRAVRYAGPDEALNFYERNIDFGRLLSSVIEPSRRGGRWEVELDVIDVASDRFVERRHYTADAATVVVVEGVLLFRRELRRYFDLRLYVAIDDETALRRAPARFGAWPPEEAIRRMREKYLPGHRLYVAGHEPEATADVVVANDEPDRPRVVCARLAGHY